VVGESLRHFGYRRLLQATVKLLVDSGADMFALSEGDPPFATARLSGHDEMCELLAPLMERSRSATQTFGSGPESHSFNVR